MKVYDSREQKFINIINNGQGHSRNLVNMLKPFLDGVCIKIDTRNKKGNLVFFHDIKRNLNDEEIEKFNSESDEVIEIIVKLLNLLKYLENEELVTFFIPAMPSEGSVEFGGHVIKSIPIPLPIYDTSIVDMMLKYILIITD